MITSYTDRAQQVEGGLAYDRVRGFVQSKRSDGVIPFGRIVCLTASHDDQVEAGGTGKPMGFALRDHGQGMNESSVGQYEDQKMVSIVDKDFVIASTVSTAGDYGDTVFFDTSDGTIEIAATPSVTMRPIGFLAQTVTAAGLCKIFVNTDLVKIPFEATTVAAATGASGEIDITWDALTNQDNVQAIEVTAALNSTGVEAFRSRLAVTATGETVTGLATGTDYDCTVKIIYKDGTSSLGVTDTATSGS